MWNILFFDLIFPLLPYFPPFYIRPVQGLLSSWCPIPKYFELQLHFCMLIAWTNDFGSGKYNALHFQELFCVWGHGSLWWDYNLLKIQFHALYFHISLIHLEGCSINSWWLNKWVYDTNLYRTAILFLLKWSGFQFTMSFVIQNLDDLGDHYQSLLYIITQTVEQNSLTLHSGWSSRIMIFLEAIPDTLLNLPIVVWVGASSNIPPMYLS